MRFKAGQIQREIDRRALSQEDFASVAGLAPNTVLKACKGGSLSKQSWLKILKAMASTPVVVVPKHLRAS